MVLVALLALVLNAGAVWRFRRAFRKEEFWPILIGALIGVPIGVTLLLEVDARLLLRVLGGVLIVYAVGSLLSRGREAPRPVPRVLGVPAGLVGGAFGAGLNTGGPPIVMYLTRRPLTPDGFKSVLQVCFVCITAVQVVLLQVKGQIPRESVIQAGPLALAVLVGLYAGAFAARWVPEAHFRSMILLVLALLGFRYLVGG